MQAHKLHPNGGSEQAPSGRNLGDEATFVCARNPARGIFRIVLVTYGSMAQLILLRACCSHVGRPGGSPIPRHPAVRPDKSLVESNNSGSPSQHKTAWGF